MFTQFLNIVDDFSREYTAKDVDTSISGNPVFIILEHVHQFRKLPKLFVPYIGLRFTSKATLIWSEKSGANSLVPYEGMPEVVACKEMKSLVKKKRVLNEIIVLYCPIAGRRFATMLIKVFTEYKKAKAS